MIVRHHDPERGGRQGDQGRRSEPYLVNIELQSSYQTDLVETIWFRQAGLFHRHRLPVLSVLVLLRREANSPSLTGSFEIRMPDGWLTNRYDYRVVRIWRKIPSLT